MTCARLVIIVSAAIQPIGIYLRRSELTPGIKIEEVLPVVRSRNWCALFANFFALSSELLSRASRTFSIRFRIGGICFASGRASSSIQRHHRSTPSINSADPNVLRRRPSASGHWATSSRFSCLSRRRPSPLFGIFPNRTGGSPDNAFDFRDVTNWFPASTR